MTDYDLRLVLDILVNADTFSQFVDELRAAYVQEPGLSAALRVGRALDAECSALRKRVTELEANAAPAAPPPRPI
jgi:hypothetical protein